MNSLLILRIPLICVLLAMLGTATAQVSAPAENKAAGSGSTSSSQTPIIITLEINPYEPARVEGKVVIPKDLDGQLAIEWPRFLAFDEEVHDRAGRVRSVSGRSTDGQDFWRLTGKPRGGQDVTHTLDRPANTEGNVTWTTNLDQGGLHSVVTDIGAYINHASCVPRVRGAEGRPHVLHIKCPSAWKAVSTLPLLRDDSPTSFQARDYRELTGSCTILAETLSVVRPAEGGARVVVAWAGEEELFPKSAEQSKLIAQFVDTMDAIIPSEPFHQEHTIGFFFLEKLGGQLLFEHGVVVGGAEGSLKKDPTPYLEKACRLWARSRMISALPPQEFIEAKDSDLPESQSLWLHHGAAHRIAEDFLLAQKAIAPSIVLDRLTDDILEHRNHLEQPLVAPEKASSTLISKQPLFDLELQSRLVAFLLDCEIRARTKDAKTLADVISSLATSTDVKKGMPAAAVLKAFNGLVTDKGLNFEAFFNHHIAGTTPLPLEDTLPKAALQFEWVMWKVLDPGLRSRQVGKEVFVDELAEGSDLHVAGLRNDDRILTINGNKIRSPHDIETEIARSKPGRKLRVDIRRGDKLKSFRCALIRDTTLRIPSRLEGDIVIVEALPPGPALDGGLQEGDILEKIDNLKITRPEVIFLGLKRARRGRVRATVRRNGRRMAMTLKAPQRVTWRGRLTHHPKPSAEAAKRRRKMFPEK